jgi:hypothetical protein
LPPFTPNSLLRAAHTPKPIQAITCDLLILSLTRAFGFVAMDLLIEVASTWSLPTIMGLSFGIPGAEIETR